MSDFETKYNGWHKKLSYVKSGVRLVGCSFGLSGYFTICFTLILIAELIGIAEEWV